MFTEKNCVRSMYESVEGDSNAGCVGIIKAEWFKAEHRIADNQLFRIGGGFGAIRASWVMQCLESSVWTGNSAG